MSELPLTALEAGEELAFTAAVMRHFHEDAERDEDLEVWARSVVRDRALVVRDRDQIVANTAVLPTDLSVPGGERLGCAAVTAVGVAQTHRRRGLLRRMMAALFDRAAEEGEPVAALYASEAPIYPRFGFGASVPTRGLRVETREVRFLDPVDDRVVLPADDETILATAAAVYDQVRRQRPGGVGRDDAAWRLHLVEDPVAWREGATARRRVHVPGRGYATYRLKAAYHPTDEVPDGEVRVEELVAADAEAEQALWQHVLSIDLTRTCTAWPRPADDALPAMVADPMRLRARVSYPMYTRLLDVPRCLASRRSDVASGVTLRVIDDVRDATATYRWEGGPDGATCVRVDATAEVTCDVSTLAALWLGGTSVATVRGARRLDEHVAGAADRLGALTRTERAPWTPWEF